MLSNQHMNSLPLCDNEASYAVKKTVISASLQTSVHNRATVTINFKMAPKN